MSCLTFSASLTRGEKSPPAAASMSAFSPQPKRTIDQVALNVNNLEEYSLAGIALTALNYFGLLVWWIKHRIQNRGDKVEKAVAMPTVTPVQPVPAAGVAAPISPCITQYYAEPQPRLFLLPKVISFYKSRVDQN